MAKLFTLLFLITVFAFAEQPETLTNESIVNLTRAELQSAAIIVLINKSECQFDLSASALIKLKKEKVRDDVIQAMLERSSGTKTTLSNHSESHTSDLPSEIGVYIRKSDDWNEVLPEVVNWKTGGVLKRVFSAGIVKGDVNGHLVGPQSRNVIELPAEFLVVTDDGIAITEYQLIKLRHKENWREFRTVTGGVFHQSGGATRDLMLFEGTKVGPRSYVVKFQTLPAGEYGFLPPSAFVSAGASSSLGKMYTFRVGSAIN